MTVVVDVEDIEKNLERFYLIVLRKGGEEEAEEGAEGGAEGAKPETLELPEELKVDTTIRLE